MSKASRRRNVTFELPLAQYRTLQDNATVRGLDSIHQRGREIVIDYLTGKEGEEVSESITAVEEQVAVSGDELSERISAVEQEVAGLKEEILHLGTLFRRLAYAALAVGPDSPSPQLMKKKSDEANEWVKKHMPTKADMSKRRREPE